MDVEVVSPSCDPSYLPNVSHKFVGAKQVPMFMENYLPFHSVFFHIIETKLFPLVLFFIDVVIVELQIFFKYLLFVEKA